MAANGAGGGPLAGLVAPLSFATKNGFAGVGRLQGFEALVRGRTAAARAAGAAPEALLERLEAAVSGWEGLDDAARVRALREVVALLAPVCPLPEGLTGAAAGPGPGEATGPSGRAARTPGDGASSRPAVRGATRPQATGAAQGGGAASPKPARATASRPVSANASAASPLTAPVLASPLTDLPGVGPSRAAAYAEKGVRTVRDLLWMLPVSWERRTHAGHISELTPGAKATVVATVQRVQERTLRKGRRMLEAVVGDGSGRLRVTFFRSTPWARRKLEPQTTVGLSGTVRAGRGGALEMAHPEILDPREVPSEAGGEGEVRPRYSEVDGVHPRAHRDILAAALPAADRLEEVLPPPLVERRHLPTPADTLRMLHDPPPDASLEALNEGLGEPHRRLIYEEFFFLQLGLGLKARGVKVEPGIAFELDAEDIEAVLRLLPFTPTGAQDRVVREIAADMARPQPMHRLLQGDVGSGKTAVAAMALALAVRAGWQAAVMAPTELLAEQHHRTLSGFLGPAGVKTVRLTGRQSAADRRAAREALASGEAGVAVGTHALIQEGVDFHRLGLVVVDEQHRFGVRQRLDLLQKGRRPDALVMTATPIPRTLAMTAYGDLDLSVLDEMPPGRTPVETKVFRTAERERVEDLVRREVAAGHQAYVVYPLIEASDTLEDVRAATEMYEHLGREVFPELRLALLHGRMASAEKDRVMSGFAAGEVDVLVATTVIEVGIDVPNASVMVVEHAERFGLSQLHQLRGRVGRGAARSYCLLVAEEVHGERVRDRLAVMEATTDGFRIAEEDLRIRGPGELLGTRQSGHPDLLFGNLARDRTLLAQARSDALDWLERDPELSAAPATARELSRRWAGRVSLGRVG